MHHFRKQVAADMDWADSRKSRFRSKAVALKVVTLALTLASTVILGLQELTFWPSLAFSMVAAVAVLSGVEPFFNWRSRWILMEEAQYRLNRLRDEVDYYLVTTEPAEIDAQKLEGFFSDWQTVWRDVSKRWIQFRKLEGDS